MNVPVCDLLTLTSTRSTVVGSLAVLLTALMSPFVATRATLVRPGAAAGATLTVSVITLLAAGASAAGLVHVTACATAPHVHPAPLAEIKPRPAGSVSATVITPVVAPVPTLVTVRV